MEKNVNEPVVYLKDILFSVLYAWKSVLCTALVFAVLLGSYKFLTVPADTEPSPEQLEAYEEEKQLLQQNADNYQLQLDAQQTFMAESLLMQLDPYNHYQLTLRYYVDTGYQVDPHLTLQTPNVSPALLSGYSSLLIGEETLAGLSALLDTQPQYVSDVMFFQDAGNTGILTLNVLLPNREDALLVADHLVEWMPQLQTQLEGTVGAHTLTLLENTVKPHIDRGLIPMQKAENDRLNTLNTQLSEAQSAVAALVAPAAEHTDGMKSSLKFAILGGAVGVFLAVVYLAVRHIARGKVYSARTLNDRTGCRILACISAEKGGFITRRLQKLEGRSPDGIQTQLPLVAAHVGNLCAPGSTLLIAGTVEPEAIRSLAQQLQPLCSGITIKAGGNLLKDAAAVEALRSCSCVLLAEQCGVSRYEDAARHTALVKEQNKDLLGFVLVGG